MISVGFRGFTRWEAQLGHAAGRGTAMLYWDYFERLKRLVGFAPANEWFLVYLREAEHDQWTLRLGFDCEWESLIRGGSDNFEDARGHPARVVRGATVLLAQGEVAL